MNLLLNEIQMFEYYYRDVLSDDQKIEEMLLRNCMHSLT